MLRAGLFITAGYRELRLRAVVFRPDFFADVLRAPPRFAALFRRYADTHVPKGQKKHRADAVAFSAFVEQVMRGDGIEPPWVVELARYEALWLNAADPTCRWMVRWFRYPMDKLVQSVVQGDGGQVSLTQPTIALWFRLSRHRRLRHVVLSLPRVVSQMLVPSWRQ